MRFFDNLEEQAMHRRQASPRSPRRRGLPQVLDARLNALRQMAQQQEEQDAGGWGTQELQGGGAGIHGMDYGQGPNEGEVEEGFQPRPVGAPQEGADVDPGFRMQEDDQMGLRERLMKRFATAVPQEPALTSRVALNRFLQQRKRPQARRPMLPHRKQMGRPY